MNSIIIEFQSDCLNINIPTTILIRKALFISHKLKLNQFIEWLENELNGYKSKETIPMYRKVSGSLKGWNQFYGYLPIVFQEKNVAQTISEEFIGQSIPELESLIKSESNQLEIPLPYELEKLVMKAIDYESKPTRIISKSSIVNIIETVKNNLLTWSLNLEKEGILGSNMTFNDTDSNKAQAVSFNIVNNFFHSKFNQTSIESINNITYKNINSKELKKIVELLKSEITTMDINSEKKEEIKADIATIESQINSPNPKQSIIRDAIKSITNIIEGFAGSVLATKFFDLLK